MSELVVVEERGIPEVFKAGGLKLLLAEIKEKTKEVVPDTSTKKGRDEIRAMAADVAKSKTYLDDLGKDLNATLKAQTAIVDKERREMRKYLTDLSVEVRLPLTEWEALKAIQLEKEKLDKEISEALDAALAENDLFDRQKAIEAKEAQLAIEAEQKRLTEEAEQKERDRIANEQRIAKEAADSAIKEAEGQAERQRQSVLKREQEVKEAAERATREAEVKAEALRLAAEKRDQDAKDAAEKAESNRLQAIEDARIAQEKAVAETERKAQAEADRKERDRLAEEARVRREAEAKAANKTHRARINNAALACLIEHGMTEAKGKKLIKAIALGEIAHVSINY